MAATTVTATEKIWAPTMGLPMRARAALRRRSCARHHSTPGGPTAPRGHGRPLGAKGLLHEDQVPAAPAASTWARFRRWQPQANGRGQHLRNFLSRPHAPNLIGLPLRGVLPQAGSCAGRENSSSRMLARPAR